MRSRSLWNWLFWIYLAVLVVALGTSSNLADADLWHGFALVDFLRQTGHFPTGDTFSYQPDYQLIPDHEWGSAFLFYPVYYLGGGAGLVILKLLLLGGTLALTVRAGLGGKPPTMLDAFFFSLVLMALLPSFLSTLRCGVFTHLFLALWVLWFQQERRGIKIPGWAYVATMIIWANLHGGFVVGLLWLALLVVLDFFGGGKAKRRLFILLACLLATFINPFGWDLWIGVARALTISRSAFEEWGPVPWFEPYNTFSAYKLLLLWMIPVVITSIYKQGWSKFDRTAVFLLGFFAVLSLTQARQTSLFAIVIGGLLPPLFPLEISIDEIADRKARLHRLVIRTILVILPLIFAARLFPSNQGLRLDYSPENSPVDAVAYLKQNHITGRLLIGFNSGSYALWALQGQMHVAMDGRYDLVYRPETFQKVGHFFASENDWRDSLEHPRPDAVLVNLPDPVYPKMLAEPGWTEAYRDSTHAVFLPH